MCIVPAGPRMRGLSPFGPANIAFGLPPTIKWPSGASVFPRLACGPKSALFKSSGACFRQELLPTSRIGKANVKTAPCGALALAQSRPPWAWMIDRLMASPMPKPCGLVV